MIPIPIRNTFSTRPYEHVLEPVIAYLMIVEGQYGNKEKYEGSYTVEPDGTEYWTTGNLVYLKGGDVAECMGKQIKEFLGVADE